MIAAESARFLASVTFLQAVGPAGREELEADGRDGEGLSGGWVAPALSVAAEAGPILAPFLPSLPS